MGLLFAFAFAFSFVLLLRLFLCFGGLGLSEALGFRADRSRPVGVVIGALRWRGRSRGGPLRSRSKFIAILSCGFSFFDISLYIFFYTKKLFTSPPAPKIPPQYPFSTLFSVAIY